MSENIVTRASTEEYRENWNKIFGGDTWKCPACGQEVDYGDSEPSGGKTWCSKTGKNVKMVRVKK